MNSRKYDSAIFRLACFSVNAVLGMISIIFTLVLLELGETSPIEPYVSTLYTFYFIFTVVLIATSIKHMRNLNYDTRKYKYIPNYIDIKEESLLEKNVLIYLEFYEPGGDSITKLISLGLTMDLNLTGNELLTVVIEDLVLPVDSVAYTIDNVVWNDQDPSTADTSYITAIFRVKCSNHTIYETIHRKLNRIPTDIISSSDVQFRVLK